MTIVKFILLTSLFACNSMYSEKAKARSSAQKASKVLSLKKDGKLSKEVLLGTTLKGILENMHFAKSPLDNSLSKKAFAEYIKRIDYGKQFLLEEDVASLKKYESQIDDQISSGELALMEKASGILRKRQKTVESYVFNRLKKPFDLNKEVTYVTDSEKRSYVSSSSDLNKRWDKILQLDILEKYAEYLEEQNPDPSDKDYKKKLKNVPKKKLTHVQLEKKARESTIKSYQRIFKRLNKENASDDMDKFFNSVTKVYDPHTHYLIPDDKEEFDIEMSGKLEGIGALLREEGSHIKVERIIPGSASWKGKELKAEDVILKVGQGDKEPVDVVDMGLKDAVKLIRGRKGSEVRLTVKKPSGLKQVISIIRDVVEVSESYVKSTIIQKKGEKRKYGYINIPKFYRDFNDRFGRNCTDDTRAALKKLKKSNVDGVVLDLRNNGGGALKDSRYITGLFIKDGPVVQVKSHNGQVEVLKDSDPGIEFDKPLIVLINRFSASASEIVAAALQDYKRAVIVGGEHSHGKGTVQAVIDLDNFIPPQGRGLSPFGALKITIQKFFRVNGSSTQYKGVTPDIILPDLYGHMESGERHLDYSLAWEKIGSVKHDDWTKGELNISKLKSGSQKRVQKHPKFAKINQSIAWFKERKKIKSKSLSLKKYLAEKKLLKAKSKQLEIDQINSNIMVIDAGKSSSEADKEKFKELKESLQKDPYIEETLAIFKDILS